jgi:hypothetical protein
MADADAREVERLRRQLAVMRAPDLPPAQGGGEYALGRVYDGGALPTTVPNTFLCHPATVRFDE